MTDIMMQMIAGADNNAVPQHLPSFSEDQIYSKKKEKMPQRPSQIEAYPNPAQNSFH